MSGQTNLDLGDHPGDLEVTALTIREPWLELILSSVKDAEYRTWRPHTFPNPVLLCAGKAWDKEAQEELARDSGLAPMLTRAEHWMGHARALCVFDEAQPAGVGCWAWRIHVVVPLAHPFRVRGQQGFFQVPCKVEHLEVDLLKAVAYRRTEDTLVCNWGHRHDRARDRIRKVMAGYL